MSALSRHSALNPSLALRLTFTPADKAANNKWGTNFSMWREGDLAYRFVLDFEDSSGA